MSRIRHASCLSPLLFCLLAGCNWSRVELAGYGAWQSPTFLQVDIPGNDATLKHQDREYEEKLTVEEFRVLQSTTKNAGVFEDAAYNQQATDGGWQEIRLSRPFRTRTWVLYGAYGRTDETPTEIRALRDHLMEIRKRLESRADWTRKATR